MPSLICLAQRDHPRDQVVGRTDSELYPEPIATANRDNDKAAVDSGGSVRNTQPFKVGGDERTFDTVDFPILNEGGDVIGVRVSHL